MIDDKNEPGKVHKSRRDFATISGHPIREIYTAEDLVHFDADKDLGEPGRFPFTRGIQKDPYREKLWSMRRFPGAGACEEVNAHIKKLAADGTAHLEVNFDLPTLLGQDSDNPEFSAEVGRRGIAVDSLADMEALFDGIRLDRLTTFLAANAPALMIWGMYLTTAERLGAKWKEISGTIQNDILEEYIAGQAPIFPLCSSMRIAIDILEFAIRHVPKWKAISIGGCQIREAGSTAIQELAFTLRDGIEYVEHGKRRGLKIDTLAPFLSFRFNINMDFFEEIAKLRAARRIWARVMKERFHAQNPSSQLCTIYGRTADPAITAAQSHNNAVRITVQALAAVLGGIQALSTNASDEHLASSTDSASIRGLRAQQIIAHESGVADTIDPMGGSFFIETLTNEIESGCLEYLERIDAAGGMISAIEEGFPQGEIEASSTEFAAAIEGKEKIIVGYNEFVTENDSAASFDSSDYTVKRRQCEKLNRLRAERNNSLLNRNLSELKRAAEGTDNLMPPILECIRSYATLGEMCRALRSVFGEHRETSIRQT